MKKLRLLLCSLGVLLTLFAAAQSGKVTRAQKKAEKKKQEQLHKQEKATLKGKKKHLSIQTAKVRKRMKKNSKRDIHVTSYDRRPGLFKRMFQKRER